MPGLIKMQRGDGGGSTYVINGTNAQPIYVQILTSNRWDETDFQFSTTKADKWPN
jgi:hypothetical protein